MRHSRAHAAPRIGVPGRYLAGAVVAAGMVGIWYLGVHDPNEAGAFPPCPVFAMTGWRCPGCGTLRALHGLLHGDLARAWEANPLAVLGTPLMVWVGVSLGVMALRGRHWGAARWPAGAPWIVLVALLGFMVARNV